MKRITPPLDSTQIKKLHRGERVFLSGFLYTARDQAHKRLIADLLSGKKLPFAIKGSVIYYCGPTKTPHGLAVGSCGPTTSSRMDAFTPILLRAGLCAMIGKGNRSEEVRQAVKRYRGVYFLTYAGCGALLAQYVKKTTPVTYKDLGPEAIVQLKVKDFPLIVGIDTRGRSIYNAKR
ncbi:MAG: FumA C-terminus/TtdB family hydratase beta subunit [Candidatus Omnitrophica bacterium]|nr:FumA C-terminus/TtdB family hydratase beta subunit [Candidatus Omnitrophota bacterium]